MGADLGVPLSDRRLLCGSIDGWGGRVMLLTPTAIDNSVNILCLPPGPLWWSNTTLDLQDDLHTVLAEIERGSVTDGLTFQAPTITLDPGMPTDSQHGRPTSMHFINGRRLRTTGYYRNHTPDDRAYLDAQERYWTGFGWPGRDRDRCPALYKHGDLGPPDGYPMLDSLRSSIPDTSLLQCPALISLLRYQWSSDGWEDPLGAPDLEL